MRKVQFQTDKLESVFYLNSKNEVKVASSATLAMEESKSSALTGIIKETFCTNCNRNIQVFEIDMKNCLYNCQDAIKILKSSLIDKRKFIEEKYGRSLKLQEIIKKGDQFWKYTIFYWKTKGISRT